MFAQESVESALEAVISSAWQQYANAKQQPWLVQPSLPILFFGNLSGYLKSKIRVLTVALNPSRWEFPEIGGDRFSRFLGGGDCAADSKRYLNVLSGYFVEKPYRPWFDFFNQALSGMDGSYCTGKNIALHTDICSCLPTDPTWSKLKYETRRQLAADGTPLWHDLLIILRPHVVIFSTARSWLDEIAFRPLSEWQVIAMFDLTGDGNPRKNPISIERRWYSVADAPTLFSYIPARQKPLAGLSHTQKVEAGRKIAEAWRAGFK